MPVSQSHARQRAALAAVVLCAAVVAGGAISFAGWSFDMPRLADWDGNGVAVQPNTALALVLCGAALWLQSRGYPRTSAVCGAIVALIGGLTLIEHLTGVNFGIDHRLTFGRNWGTRATVAAGRMGPPASLAFTLLGSAQLIAALSTPSRGRARRLVPLLAIAVGAIVSVSLIGHALGVDELHAIPSITAIAWQTATMLLMLSAAVVLYATDQEPARTLLSPGADGILFRRALPLAVGLPVLVGFLRVQGQNSGYFDTPTGTALTAVVMVIVLAITIWSGARLVGTREAHIIRFQQQLAEREEFLAGILGSITDALYVLDRDARFIFVNDEIVHRFGKSREAILGVRAWDLFPEAVRAEVFVQQELAMSQRICVEYEVYYAPWNRWYHDTAYPTADGGLAVYSQDVTKSKVAEAMLQSKERELATIVNLSPFMMTRCSRDLRYLFVSKAYATMLGRSPEELVGKRIVEIMGEDGFRTIEPYVQQVLSGQVVRYDSAVRFYDVGERMLSVEYTPDRDAEGNVTGWVASIMDLTERKLAEIERERLLESERSARIEAEQAARIKDEFLATLSHELRTPLSAIVGWISMIEKRPGDQKVLADALPVISRNARAQARLISDLLDMSRILAGKIKLERRQVDMTEVIKHAVQSLQLSAEDKQVRIETVFEPIDGVVRGDFARLQQVLNNVLSNAVKFCAEQGCVRVHLHREADHAVVTVSDNGAGISPEFLPHVFDKFRQADGSASRQHGGLGLGLAIVKHLVQSHGGTVHADSPGLGKGSKFTLRLPLALDTVVRAGNEDFPTEPYTTNHVDLGGIKILAVDDHHDSAVLVQRILEDCHAVVLLAGSAEEAVRLIHDEHPDVVLCDLGMPGRDGYQFMRDLRASGDATPAIALTAFVRMEDRDRALQAGFNAHLTKPIDAPELVTTVARVARVTSLR